VGNGRGGRRRGGHKADSDDLLGGAKTAAAGILKRNAGLEAKLAARLDAAGSELKPAEWLLVHSGVALVVTLLGLLLSGGNLVLGFVFLGLGILCPWIYLGFARRKRRKAFGRALPDTLQLISGSLAAGLSLAQSLDTVANDGTEPVASEFRRVLVETRLGVNLEDALQGVADRFESKDFGWVVMAIGIQRQVGGNLAELLDTVAATRSPPRGSSPRSCSACCRPSSCSTSARPTGPTCRYSSPTCAASSCSPVAHSGWGWACSG
jgi:tight adherence protein B